MEWKDSYKKVVRHFLKGAKAGTVFESVDAGQTAMCSDIDKIAKDEGVLRSANGRAWAFLRAEMDLLGRKAVWVRREDKKGWGRNT